MLNNKVSIIIPVYNAEMFLKDCVDSIINQTYEDIEILLINDGSTDKTGNMCEEYAKKDQRIVVIHKENGGVSSARNVGINKSSGNYIMFVDSDDWIENDTIHFLVNIQEKNDYDIIMFGAYHENLVLNTIQKSNCKSRILDYNSEVKKILPILIKTEQINPLWNKMYRSDIIKTNNITFEETINIAEDALFNYRFFLKINTCYILDECFYHYMIRNIESLTQRYNPRKYNMLIWVNDYMQQELQKYTECNEVIKALKHIRVKNIYSCFLDLCNGKKKLAFKDKKRIIKDIITKETDWSKYHSDNLLYKLLIVVILTRNTYLIYTTTYLISKIR